ncbi:hypothetical protein IJX73_03700 [bacterium]|nr:hypothetical protein [bacterium]
MQKISPLRSSIEAFNKFKALRANKTDKAQKTEQAAQTNPFGITFKGTVIQMDVFEKTEKADKAEKAASPSLKERLQNTGKLLASAWVGTINKFSSFKTNAIAFGNKIKDNTIAFGNKIREIGNTKVELDVFKYNVSRLQNQPVSELKSLLSNELQGVTNEQ